VTRRLVSSFVAAAALLSIPGMASAHCDTLDGPVVTTARHALESGKLEPVLAWVRSGDEAEIREAFTMARAVRKTGKEGRELADRFFFETLVRVHRAGEGAPFTGLKPAGTVEPAVAAADRAIASGDAKALEELLVGAVRHGVHEHHARLKKEKAPADDVAAGRRWVAAYVPYVHWAEGVHAAATGGGAHGEKHAAGAEKEHAGEAQAEKGHGEHRAPAAAKAEHRH
jgi:hypothetical protein